MKKLILISLIVCIASAVNPVFSSNKKQYSKASACLEKKGEVYFKFNINTRAALSDLTNIISIDNVSGSEVYAYANKSEFETFLTRNLAYEVLTHPGDLLKNPKMSDYNDRNNREWDSYPTYQGYVNLLNQFATDHPSLCKVMDLGPAGVPSKNHRIYAVKISDNVNSEEAEPEFVYSATIHGDEVLGYVTTLHFIDSLLSGYSSDSLIKYLVDNIEIWILPLCNPDGTYVTGDSTVSGAQRYNVADNFDLNRNCPCPCSQGNHKLYGLYSKYATETKTRLDFEKQHNFNMSADLHAGTECALWPYHAIIKRHADELWFKHVASGYANAVHISCGNNGYFTSCGGDGVGHGFTEMYEAHGTIMDSRTHFQYCRTLCLEQSITKMLSASQLITHWEWNRNSLFNYLHQVLYGIRGVVTDLKTGQPLKAKVFIENHDADSSHVFSSLTHGDYYRPIYAGTYSVTFSSDGYFPQTISNVKVANDSATVLNVQLNPQIAIRVMNPNGKNQLYVGDTAGVTWSTWGPVGNVKIEYSTNNGSAWSAIVNSTENDGLYNWPVPNELSALSLIRVSEASDPSIADTSDSVFTIAAPEITLISPNGDEQIYAGDKHMITWSDKGYVGNVKIEYSTDSGSTWFFIVDNEQNDGSCEWTTPDKPSVKCLIRISESSDDTPVDLSNHVFSILAPTISLSSPNGGEMLYAGDKHPIVWSDKGFVGDVKIEYSIDSGTAWSLIVNNEPNDGSCEWTIPDKPSFKCFIRISEASDGNPVDVCNAVFTILPPVILLSSPNGGEAWYIGKSYPITWSTKGFVGDVSIHYSTNNGKNWSIIAADTSNNGSHPWTIPDQPSDSCRIRISEASDGAPADTSREVFRIEIEPSITLAFPVGGEVFYIDTVYTIRWSTVGKVVNVKIEYSMNNGTTWSLITSQTEDDGQYDWKVPSIAPGTCILRVSDASDGAPNDVSNHFYLEYAPSVTVTYPNGGEIFYIGMVYKLWWSNKGSVGDIKIDYTTDNGTTWKVVVSRINNTGTYNWKIPDDQSVHCRIRVSDASNDAIVDISDALFSIAPPYIRVSAPNGGEVWYTGYKHTINWKGEGFLGNVNIEYSTDNGSSWKSIAGNTGNVGTYAWTVPNEPSATCRVRVSEATGANPVDESDQSFAIQFGTGINTITGPGKFFERFQILPNPADITVDQSVSFVLTASDYMRNAELMVFDALGNSIYKTSAIIQTQRSSQRCVLGTWDLKNKQGKRVESGAYLVVLTIEDKQGKITIIKRMVGVKETK